MPMAHSHSTVHSEAPAFRGVLPAALLAGVAGGLIMIGLAMAYAKNLGLPVGRPLKWIAAALYGEQALYRDEANVRWSGLILHLLTSLFWAVFFTLFTSRRDSAAKSLGLGLAFGAAVWLMMTYCVLPFIDPVMSAEMADLPFVWFSLHLCFGASLSMTPLLSRIFAGAPDADLHFNGAVPSGH